MITLHPRFLEYCKEQGYIIDGCETLKDGTQYVWAYEDHPDCALPIAKQASKSNDVVYWLDLENKPDSKCMSEEEMLRMIKLKAFW